MYIKNFILPSWWLLFAFCNWTSVWAVKIYFIITPLLSKAPEVVQISIRYKLFQDNYRWLHALFMQCIQSVPWKIMSLKVSLQNQPSHSNGLVLNNRIQKSILQPWFDEIFLDKIRKTNFGIDVQWAKMFVERIIALPSYQKTVYKKRCKGTSMSRPFFY